MLQCSTLQLKCPEPVMFSDIALIHNNAKVGSQIACALSKQMTERKTHHRGKHSSDSDIVSINTYDGLV